MNTEIINSISTFSSYQRKQSIENHYGSPIFDIWDLYKRVKPDKGSIVVTFHLICHTAGKDLAFANRNLNRYTLALYYNNKNKYTDGALNAQHEYSEPNVYGWIYGTNLCGEKNLPLRIKKVSSILESKWAAATIDDLGTTADKVHNMLETWTKGGLKTSQSADVRLPETSSASPCHQPTFEDVERILEDIDPNDYGVAEDELRGQIERDAKKAGRELCSDWWKNLQTANDN